MKRNWSVTPKILSNLTLPPLYLSLYLVISLLHFHPSETVASQTQI